MTPLAKLVGRVAEKIAGTWNEGPELPARLRRQPVEFAASNPLANRDAWRRFCERLAEACYRAGFQRGFEHSERDPEPSWRALPPELEADARDPDWRHPSRAVQAPGVDPERREVFPPYLGAPGWRTQTH